MSIGSDFAEDTGVVAESDPSDELIDALKKQLKKYIEVSASCPAMHVFILLTGSAEGRRT